MKKVHEKTTHISGGNLVNDHLALGVTSSKVLTVGRVGQRNNLQERERENQSILFDQKTP